MESHQAPDVARPDTPDVDEPKATPDVTARRAAISGDPAIAEHLRAVVQPLDDVADRPVNEHAEAYDAVHRDLRAMLDDIDAR
ncbi:MAG: hypothetical protein ACK5MR_12885 [Cumulibacter sp.]